MQIENEIGPERSQTQELPNTPSKESTKHDNEADELPQNNSSVKEISSKGSDTSAGGLTQRKSSVKETSSKGSVASEVTAEGSTRNKSSVKVLLYSQFLLSLVQIRVFYCIVAKNIPSNALATKKIIFNFFSYPVMPSLAPIYQIPTWKAFLLSLPRFE